MESIEDLLNQFNKRYLIFKGTEYVATTEEEYKKAFEIICERMRAGEKGRVVESYRA